MFGLSKYLILCLTLGLCSSAYAASGASFLIMNKQPATSGSTIALTANQAAPAQLPQDYYLEFDGFGPQDMANLEEYLLVFSGYLSHQPTEQRHTRTTLLYQSNSGSAMLSRNLHKLLDELNMRATISFSENTFRVKRITLRGENPTRDIADGW